MTPERWKQIEKLYHAALKLEPGQRTAFLKEGCTGDEDLRQEVESLLAHQPQAESLIQAPALEVAAKEMAQNQAHSLVGRQIGAYKITSLLGAGGMGEVYLAEDTRLGRPVAVKVLPAELARDKDRMQRFVREARAASALNHANGRSKYCVQPSAQMSVPRSNFPHRLVRPVLGQRTRSEALTRARRSEFKL